MSILTEAEKNKIKRDIGEVFWNELMHAEVKLILKKPSHKRTEKEIDRLVSFLKRFEYMKNKNLTYGDYRELSQTI